MSTPETSNHQLKAGMIGMGMIFDETYAPMFRVAKQGIYDSTFGVCEVDFSAVATRTGSRAEKFREANQDTFSNFTSYTEPNAAGQLVSADP
ncbi:hypothetical protein N9L71_12290, partial [Verrucomicrobiales bacterium]|nr:hypothetical protein [Verrucomicrobiales bacterium]